MKTMHALKATMAATALLCCVGAQAATMAKAEYNSAKEEIENVFKTEKNQCDSLAGNAKDICVAEANGHEKVSKAELDYRNSGTQRDMQKVNEARAESAYSVAKERCDDKAGNEKDVCIKEAKAAQAKAKADAKLNREVGEARRDAAVDKMDADYRVAAEKCDAMAGDAKSACLDNAKVQYGKR